MNDADDIVKEFLIESYENLDRLDRDLVMLEKSPDDREILASVFRTIHTIKGTSGFLAFNKLGAVAHVGESLLGRLRDGQLALDGEITTALLTMVDAVRQMLTSIETSGLEGERDDSALISELTRLQHAEASDKGKAKEPGKSKVAAVAAGAGALSADASVKVASSGVSSKHGKIEVVTVAAEPGKAAAAGRRTGPERRRQHDPAGCQPARSPDESGGRTGAGAQSNSAVRQQHRREYVAGREPTPEPDYDRTPRWGDEDPHAAHRQYLEQASAHGPRPGARLRQAGAG
jgi:two-component system chemotaxis sensor kinase CheA